MSARPALIGSFAGGRSSIMPVSAREAPLLTDPSGTQRAWPVPGCGGRLAPCVSFPSAEAGTGAIACQNQSMTARGKTPSSRSRAPGSGQRKPRTKWSLDQGLAIVAASAVTAAGGFLTAWVLRAPAATPARAPALPPSAISITNPQSGAHVGLMTAITGTIDNLRPGQMVWVLTQPYTGTGRPSKLFFPAIGPCPVDQRGIWSCRIQVGSAADVGHEFAIWATVVTSAQGYANARLEALPTGSGRYFIYSTSSDLPHASGIRPVSLLVTRCPQGQTCT
jgi:hypothetical protein